MAHRALHEGVAENDTRTRCMSGLQIQIASRNVGRPKLVIFSPVRDGGQINESKAVEFVHAGRGCLH